VSFSRESVILPWCGSSEGITIVGKPSVIPYAKSSMFFAEVASTCNMLLKNCRHSERRNI